MPLGTGTAMADQRCNVPLAEWQPRAALQQQVEAQGWRVTRIRTKDGCYRVQGTNERGERYEGTFHPGTLRVLKVEIEYD
ncbi:PepSY domain-containing protein [Falsiroseomonas sp. E2-1-a4]|uniref:PepSY domain-containing protein n=1 Tax=Falsiroseomonas sp. E2-1-a4 TaxID=3239299 RepID=UPI003F2A8ECC